MRIDARLRKLEERRPAPVCRACGGHYVVGVPGLFAVAYRPRGAHDPPDLGTHVRVPDEELEEHEGVCDVCGEDWKTYVISMRGIAEKPPLPDPYPYRLWPEAPRRVRPDVKVRA